MKNFAIITFLFLSGSIFGQNFDRQYFLNTDWFTEKDVFSEVDTIKLIKHTNLAPKHLKEWEYAENEMKYLSHGNFFEFGFRRGKKFNYVQRIDNYIYKISLKKYTWKYDRKKSIISVFENENLLFKLKPLYSKEIDIDSKFQSESKLKTIEVTFLKL